MRFVELQIIIHDKDEAETEDSLGLNDYSEKIRVPFNLDLDRVECFWHEPAQEKSPEGVSVHMHSGEFFFVPDMSNDAFKKLLLG